MLSQVIEELGIEFELLLEPGAVLRFKNPQLRLAGTVRLAHGKNCTWALDQPGQRSSVAREVADPSA